MNPLFVAALDLQGFCLARGWRFCFIGGLVVHRWGDARLTLDVDCTILTGLGGERPFIDALLDAYPARVDAPRDFALANRVVLLRAANDVPLDVSLAAMPFEERCIDRATPFPIGGGQTLVTASAEDLIVLKAFAGRDRDWADIDGILLRQAGRIDAALIWRELAPLLELKEDEASGPRLRALMERRR